MKFVTSLAIAVFLTWSLTRFVSYETPKDVLHTGQYAWTFTPAGEAASYNFRPGADIGLELPHGVQCCQGEINVSIPVEKIKKIMRENPESTRALYFPAIGGTFEIAVNGNPIVVPAGEYSSVGPIALLPSETFKGDRFNLRIKLNSPSNGYAGLWKEAPYVGDFQVLQLMRDHDRAHQILVPFASSIIFSAIALVFLLIYFRTKKRYYQYKIFGVCILAWALFYFSLSGVPRSWNYQLSSLMHLPTRSLAALSLFVLIHYYISYFNGKSSEVKEPAFKHVVFTFLAVIFLQIVTPFFGGSDLQHYLHPVGALLTFSPLIPWSHREYKYRSIEFLFYTVIITIFVSHTSDVIRVLNGLWGFEYKAPYFDRYSTPVLLLTSIVIYFLHSFSLFDDLAVHYDRLKKFSHSALAMTSHQFNEQHFDLFANEISAVMKAEKCLIVKRVDGIMQTVIGSFSKTKLQARFSELPIPVKQAFSLEKVTRDENPLKFVEGSNWLHKLAVPVPLGRRPDYVIYLEKFYLSREIPDADVHNMELLSWLLSLQIEKSVSADLSEKVASYEKRILEQARFEAIANTTEMLAHDIRHPFALLRMMIAVVQSSLSADLVKQTITELIPEIERTVDSVDAMIKDLFEVGSNAPVKLQEASLGLLVKSVVRDIEKIYPNQNINFRYEFDDRHTVNMDSPKIARVLANIASNAVESMKEGGEITISISIIEIEIGRFQQVKIHNTGTFVDENTRQKLFDEFFTSGKANGTGLGLAISKKIIQDHGGKIWCGSDPTLGTCFYFTLPV